MALGGENFSHWGVLSDVLHGIPLQNDTGRQSNLCDLINPVHAPRRLLAGEQGSSVTY